ncbi:ATP-binding response regulator [Flexithrix dorotheae]|uniref:ATP-binding response regulator n=1 Tax=Flexithrix dorotheae TaxID=70993 RepID=UPI000369C039|nr:hybrid sensor histidine kinase/response regulator [Flexithrix dorotheae]
MAYKILVIDDMKSVFNAVREILEPRDCLVDFAADGHSGIEKLINGAYDLIILDIHLPDHNGLKLCRRIKKLDFYGHIPVLLLTSDIKNLDEGLKVGASDYILKPFNKVEMIARVFTQIRLSQKGKLLQSEKKQLKKDLEDKRERLIEIESDLQHYFYQTSHKIRSPICSIQGLINLLGRDFPEVLENVYFQKINQSVNRIESVNEQLAIIGNIRSNEPCPSIFNLHDLIREILDETHSVLGGVQINIDITPDVDLFADREIFKNGLIPIIDNAVFYASKSLNGEGRVNIEIAKLDQAKALVIQDNGSGIKDKYQNKIFDMFFIGDEYSKGNGLGLFISKIAFEQLGWKLHIQSEKNLFTRAIINFHVSEMTVKRTPLN